MKSALSVKRSLVSGYLQHVTVVPEMLPHVVYDFNNLFEDMVVWEFSG